MIFERFIKTLFCLFAFFRLSAQDFSNKGTEFWVGYGYHQVMTNGLMTQNGQDMVLYFTSDVAATVTVEIPAAGWIKTYQVAANGVTESDPIPKSGTQDARLLTEGLYNTGIHITSNNPIVAYTHIYETTVSGASLLFPVNTLGQDYYSLNFTQKSNIANSNCWAYVIATEDNTAVEIIPSANTLTHTAGQSFTVTLNKGQIYNIMGTVSGNEGTDLTGTRIRSVSTGTAACKRIAVFSGSGRLSINCDNAVSSSDNTIQQVFPGSAWGKKYLTVPTASLPNNYFRIAVSDPATVVKVDGVQINNITNGFYYDIQGNTPKSIVSDKPIMVAQFITSGNVPTCGNSTNGLGDPEMIYLSPTEQTIDKITLNSTKHFTITNHYINVVIKSSAVNSFMLDGVSRSANFSAHPQDPAFSYAVFSVAAGAHNLKADSGFNAIAYGYGISESYGYNAGTNIKNLNQYLSLQNEYGAVSLPLTCRNTKCNLFITLPYKGSSLTWDFSNNPNISPNQTVTQNNPGPDSTFVRDGNTFYVFKLPGYYSFNSIGTFPIKITSVNTSADGCSGQQQMSYDVTVIAPQTTSFTFTHSGCITDTVYFKDASNGNGHPLQKWRWQFGDGTTDTVTNPHKAFAVTGTYNVTETTINDIGCSADTTVPFTIAPQPVAKFSFLAPACEKTPVTFTDQSTITAGKITKWYWKFVNGNALTTLNYTTNTAVTQTYSSATSVSASLVVENESGCKSALYSQLIAVHSSPVISFDMPGACLPAADARFTNLTTIADGTQNALTYSWAFGDGGTSTVKSPQHIYTTAGPFSVNLKATSADGCAKDSTKIFSNIYPQPIGAFSTVPSKICVTDSVHFVDVSSAKNSTITQWFWKFGDGQTSTLSNPAHKYADSGSYLVSLYVTSAAGCASDTARQIIYVNKSPTAAFAISGATCQGQPFTITDQSKANSGTIVNWYWNFGDGTSQKYLNGNPFTKSINRFGNDTVSLIVETDNGCKSDSAKQIIAVSPSPVANFITPNVCVNDPSAAFTDSSYMPSNATGAPFTYRWNFGDANATALSPNTSTTQNPQHKYAAAGSYNVSLTITSTTGCSATISKSFFVNGGTPKADFSVMNAGTICSKDQVNIQNNSSVDIGSINKVQIIWDFQNNPAIVITDSAAYIGKIYAHTYPAKQTAQKYQVKLIAFSGSSCFDEKVIPVTVNPSPAVTFSAIAGVCLNDNAVTITQASETSGVTGSFVFFGNGVSSSGVFNPAVAGAGTSAIKYVYTSAAGCKDSAIQTIEVIANPTVTLISPVYVLAGGSAILNPSVTGNAVKYLWSPATYLNNAAIRNPQTMPKDSITYTLTAATQSGCEGTGFVTVRILKNLGIPNAFSPNGDGVNDVWNIVSLSSFPNTTVQVFNRYGAAVYSMTGYSKPWDGTFNGNPLPAGVYYYIINLKNGGQPYTGYVTILK